MVALQAPLSFVSPYRRYEQLLSRALSMLKANKRFHMCFMYLATPSRKAYCILRSVSTLAGIARMSLVTNDLCLCSAERETSPKAILEARLFKRNCDNVWPREVRV